MLKKLLPIVCVLLLCGCASTKQVVIHGTAYLVDTGANTLSDGIHTYSYAISRKAVEITYPNGAWYYSTKGGISYSDDYHEVVDNKYTNGGLLAEAVRKVEGNPESRLAAVVSGVLLGGIGLAMVLFPEVFFYLRYGWMLQDAEPSDAAIRWCRFSGGAVLVLIIIFVLIN